VCARTIDQERQRKAWAHADSGSYVHLGVFLGWFVMTLVSFALSMIEGPGFVPEKVCGCVHLRDCGESAGC
jgi:hypothetical protein